MTGCLVCLCEKSLRRNKDCRYHEGNIDRHHHGIGGNRTGQYAGQPHDQQYRVFNRPRKINQQTETTPDNPGEQRASQVKTGPARILAEIISSTSIVNDQEGAYHGLQHLQAEP